VVLPTFSPKPRRNTAQAHLDVVKLRLHQLARAQHRTRLEPHPVHILAIRLHRHRLEGIAHVPRLQKLHRTPAWRIAANNHCDNGRASSSTRAKLTSREPSHKIKASGSLATLSSATILPLASTTHTLAHSNDASIPA
jgi:hypothetical protein